MKKLGAVLAAGIIGLTGTTTEDASAASPSGITCPSGTAPAGGWPLVFTWNGNCFRSVSTGSLAGEVNTALVNGKIACAATIAHSDILTSLDMDNIVRNKVIPLITKNRAFINSQKIGAVGFSAGGTEASYLGTRWAKGIDPVTFINYNFRVGAVVNLYGPLRMDRSSATDFLGNDTGGGGLFYLHELRKNDNNVDIPSIRQWDSQNCYCAARGTSQCACDYASQKYYDAYMTAYNPLSSQKVCSFLSDEINLHNMSVTEYIEDRKPAHVAPMYLCQGWKDSNVDADMNIHQAVSWWRPESSVIVELDDGHGFPISACNTAATAQGIPQPLTWMKNQLNVLTDSPPVYR